MERDYKFFNNDIVKFSCSTGVLYFKVIKDPESFFTTSYELEPWEVYENTINNCWDWDKLQKVKTKYSETILNYHLFKTYNNKKYYKIYVLDDNNKFYYYKSADEQEYNRICSRVKKYSECQIIRNRIFFNINSIMFFDLIEELF